MFEPPVSRQSSAPPGQAQAGPRKQSTEAIAEPAQARSTTGAVGPPSAPRTDALGAVLARAVQRRAVRPGSVHRPLLARDYLLSPEAARDWLRGVLNTPPARTAGQTDQQYVTALISASPMHNTDADEIEYNVDAVMTAIGKFGLKLPVDPAARVLPRKRTLTPKEWNHIVNGEIKAGKIVGLHTKRGAMVAVPTGSTTPLETRGDCYQQTLEYTDPKGKKGNKTTKLSTFYPDAWTLEDIRDAIETATLRSQGSAYYDVNTAKGAGMVLFTNTESWFPIDP